MKHLEDYNNIKEQIEDILLELTDQNFKTNIEKIDLSKHKLEYSHSYDIIILICETSYKSDTLEKNEKYINFINNINKKTSQVYSILPSILRRLSNIGLIFTIDESYLHNTVKMIRISLLIK